MNAALLSGLLVLAAPEPAEESDPLVLDPIAMRYDKPNRVEWDESWDRFRWWQYVTTGVMGPGGLALRFYTEPPKNNFGDDILFDSAAQDLLLLDSVEGRGLARDIGNGLFYGAMVYRLVDDLAVVGLGHGNGDVALQMLMMDLQAYSIVSAVMWSTQLFVGRTRPHSERCDDPGVQDGDLGCASDDTNNRYRSFIAGHPASIVAAAGTTCIAHSRMPIYGGGWGDNLACASMVGASAAMGALRIMSGSHHASDVMFGTALGFFAGWIVPWAMHYGFDDDDDDDEMEAKLEESSGDNPGFAMAFVPVGPGGGVGVQVAGVVF